MSKINGSMGPLIPGAGISSISQGVAPQGLQVGRLPPRLIRKQKKDESLEDLFGETFDEEALFGLSPQILNQDLALPAFFRKVGKQFREKMSGEDLPQDIKDLLKEVDENHDYYYAIFEKKATILLRF